MKALAKYVLLSCYLWYHQPHLSLNLQEGLQAAGEVLSGSHASWSTELSVSLVTPALLSRLTGLLGNAASAELSAWVLQRLDATRHSLPTPGGE